MQKLIILDKTDRQVYIKNFNFEDWEDILRFLVEHGFDPDLCDWMLVDKVILNID